MSPFDNLGWADLLPGLLLLLYPGCNAPLRLILELDEGAWVGRADPQSSEIPAPLLACPAWVSLHSGVSLRSRRLAPLQDSPAFLCCFWAIMGRGSEGLLTTEQDLLHRKMPLLPFPMLTRAWAPPRHSSAEMWSCGSESDWGSDCDLELFDHPFLFPPPPLPLFVPFVES